MHFLWLRSFERRPVVVALPIAVPVRRTALASALPVPAPSSAPAPQLCGTLAGGRVAVLLTGGALALIDHAAATVAGPTADRGSSPYKPVGMGSTGGRTEGEGAAAARHSGHAILGLQSSMGSERSHFSARALFLSAAGTPDCVSARITARTFAPVCGGRHHAGRGDVCHASTHGVVVTAGCVCCRELELPVHLK